MAEGLFALANIFSFCRICFLLPANQALGPLQITLGKMISVSRIQQKKEKNLASIPIFFLKDIMKFIFIFLIIFAAFMFSLNNLYWYYQSNTRGNVEIVSHYKSDNSTDTQAEKAFGT
jgi:transient receptor potential cation channel subfamily C protein 4